MSVKLIHSAHCSVGITTRFWHGPCSLSNNPPGSVRRLFRQAQVASALGATRRRRPAFAEPGAEVAAGERMGR